MAVLMVVTDLKVWKCQMIKMPFASPFTQTFEIYFTDLRLVWLPPTPSPSSFTYLTDTLLDDDDSARDDLENDD